MATPMLQSASMKTHDLTEIQHNRETQTTLPLSSPLVSSTLARRRRKEVAVFVKVLLDYLARCDRSSMERTKKVVSECILKNRSGSPGFEDLALIIQKRTRLIIGEWHWSRVRLIILYARQVSCQKSNPHVIVEESDDEEGRESNKKNTAQQLVLPRTA